MSNSSIVITVKIENDKHYKSVISTGNGGNDMVSVDNLRKVRETVNEHIVSIISDLEKED